jgi:hypothetical protein
MKKQVVAIVMLALMVSVGNAFGYKDVSPVDAFNMIDGEKRVGNEEVFILDVRTPQEWNWVGHPGQNKIGEGAVLEGHVLNIAYQIYHEGQISDRINLT